MSLRKIGLQSQSLIRIETCLLPSRRHRVKAVEPALHFRETCKSESKVWVKLDRLFEKLLGLQPSVTKHVRTISVIVRLNVKHISVWILRRRAIEAHLLVGRKLGLQLVGDGFGDLALNREHVR